MTTRRAVLLLAGLVVVLNADILFLGRGLFLNDLTSYHYPMKRVVREAVTSGEFPYWNRYDNGGQPLAANPAYELFYPPQWLLYVLPFHFAFQLHLLIHFLIAAIGMYVLLRDFNLQPIAALFGAALFILGGPYLSLTSRLPLLFALSWMPLGLALARRFLLERKRRDLFLAALVLGMQLLIGEPTVVLQTWGLIGVYAVARMRRNGWKAIALGVVLLGIGGLLVAAVQLVPAVDHARDSVRSRPFNFLFVSNWSMPLQRVAELAEPSIFRHVMNESGAPAITTMYPYRTDAFLFEIYVGLLIVILAVAGFLAGLRGRWAALGLIIGSVVFAAGDHTPLLRLLYDLGLMRSLRYPEKFILTAAFVLVVWSAFAFDRFLEGDRKVLRHAFTTAIAALIVAAILVLAVRSSFFAINLGRAAAALIVIMVGRRRRDAVWLALVALFAIGDLWYATRDLVPRMPRRYFDPPPIASKLPREGRVYHEAAWQVWDNDPVAASYFITDRDRYWWLWRNGLFPNELETQGAQMALQEDIDLTSLTNSDDLRNAFKAARATHAPGAEEPFLRMSNVVARLRFVPPTDATRNADPESVQPVELVSGPAYPRYWFDGNGEVVRAHETWNRVEIDVRAGGQTFLNMAITAHKYWSATIDGRPAPLVPANIAYQGIAVPPGAHRIEMRYRNPLIAVGAAITLLWSAVASATALKSCLTKRRSSPP